VKDLISDDEDEPQKRTRHRSAKTYVRIQLVFALIQTFRKARLLRCKGLARTKVSIGPINLAQNLRCLVTTPRQQKAKETG